MATTTSRPSGWNPRHRDASRPMSYPHSRIRPTKPATTPTETAQRTDERSRLARYPGPLVSGRLSRFGGPRCGTDSARILLVGGSVARIRHGFRSPPVPAVDRRRQLHLPMLRSVGQRKHPLSTSTDRQMPQSRRPCRRAQGTEPPREGRGFESLSAPRECCGIGLVGYVALRREEVGESRIRGWARGRAGDGILGRR